MRDTQFLLIIGIVFLSKGMDEKLGVLLGLMCLIVASLVGINSR